jgi:hypothetical protein
MLYSRWVHQAKAMPLPSRGGRAAKKPQISREQAIRGVFPAQSRAALGNNGLARDNAPGHFFPPPPRPQVISGRKKALKNESPGYP